MGLSRVSAVSVTGAEHKNFAMKTWVHQLVDKADEHRIVAAVRGEDVRNRRSARPHPDPGN